MVLGKRDPAPTVTAFVTGGANKIRKMNFKPRFRPLLPRRVVGLAAVALAAFALWPAGALAAVAQPRLGTAANYAVLAGSAITNTGPTLISGRVGLSPGSAITGFPPGSSGPQDVNNATAILAQSDLVTAYNDAAGATPFTDLSGLDLGGRTLTPGVYRFSSTAQLTGTLTLDGQGAVNPTFIFQVGRR